MPELVGQRDESRGWETLGFPASVQGTAEMIQRLNIAVKRTSASPACVKLTTPGVCKCVFVLKGFVSQWLSQLWGETLQPPEREGCDVNRSQYSTVKY